MFQIALFYQDREDVQTKQSIVTSIESGLQGGLCPCSFTDYIGNAVKGSNYGIELELLWLISNKADLFFNLGLLETEFENYLSYSHVDSDLKNGIPVNLTGRDQSHAPQYQLNFGLNYRITENLNIPFIFKASFKKANRSKLTSFTGIGDEKALEILKEIGTKLDIPTLTDIHIPSDASLAANYVDILQNRSDFSLLSTYRPKMASHFFNTFSMAYDTLIMIT